MTIYRYKWERYFAWYLELAFVAGVMALAIEFASDQFDWSKPSAGRSAEIVAHGFGFWVSPLIWWAVRGFVDGRKS